MNRKPTHKDILDRRGELNRSYLKIKARLTCIGVMATKLGINNDNDMDHLHASLAEHFKDMGEWMQEVDKLYEKSKESYQRKPQGRER